MAPDRPVLLIDLPGFAESERIDFGDEPEEVWADALKRVIDTGGVGNIQTIRALNLDQKSYHLFCSYNSIPPGTEIGSENYWLAGHSFGAYLAGLLSIEEKKNIDG